MDNENLIRDEQDLGAAHELWRAGNLSWLLHSSQRDVYLSYRRWQVRRQRGSSTTHGRWDRIFVFDCSRRWGKDWLSIVVRLEDAIKRDGSIYFYATALAKDVRGIVLPLFDEICKTAPPDLTPKFQGSREGEGAAIWLPNGSRIRLSGLDRSLDGVRGRFADGATITEAGFVRKLEEAVLSVIYPQLQQRRWADILLVSTPPDIEEHVYDEHFVPDAINRGAYEMRTIEHNPRLTDSEVTEFREAARHISPSRERREYYCIRDRDESKRLLPEWDVVTMQREHERPKHAVCYTVVDPGSRDHCAVLWGYWDFLSAKLVIERSWSKPGAGTLEIADVIKSTERDLWSGDNAITSWTGSRLEHVVKRWSDVDLRLIRDMSTEHGMKVLPTARDNKEAALHALRVAIGAGKVVALPSAGTLGRELQAAVWNESRTDFGRSSAYGHFDRVAALVYMWRNVQRNVNPYPPGWLGNAAAFVTTAEKRSVQDRVGSEVRSVFGRRGA